MADMNIDLTNLNMSEEELFTPVDRDALESEKITAPRYSYWQSVFRVFFRKKINTVILVLLAIVIAFTYIYPAVIGYDATVTGSLQPSSRTLNQRVRRSAQRHNHRVAFDFEL